MIYLLDTNAAIALLKEHPQMLASCAPCRPIRVANLCTG
jgi:predicted nucleic acid-binding protein